MDKCDEDVKTLTLNYKAFMREIKEDKINWDSQSMFIDQKTQGCYDINSSQIEL